MYNDLRMTAFHFGENIVQIEAGEDKAVYQMVDNSGDGLITLYHVFPGVTLMYNDFHMEGCLSEFYTDVPILGIDHCCEGRIEWEMIGGNFLYLQEGDLQIDSRIGHAHGFGFPLQHYHGITIAINIEEAKKSMQGVFSEFGIDVEVLYNSFCKDKPPFIKRADDSIAHIFSELYSGKKEHRIPHYRVKVLELLLFLQGLDPEKKETRMYFPKRQVKTIKEIAQFITENLDKRYSIEVLARRFNIASTTLKLCFKGVYGAPIGQYLREYRMNEAARMLQQSNETVASIAGKVGYDNQSKFAAAFKAVKGKSPKEYSKIDV